MVGFNPRSLREGATRLFYLALTVCCFNPRSLREGATIYDAPVLLWLASFNPRSLREGATFGIHPSAATKRFNPRSLREGATASPWIIERDGKFQSTLPA